MDPSSSEAKHLLAFIEPMVDKKTGALAVNWDDELVKGTLIAKDGAIVNAMIAERASAAPVSASKSGNGAETVAKKNGEANRPAPKGGKT